ncbi:MAG: hypothetical protein NTW48_09210 [Chloroflexi bacterium]|nr:hypothetical protein [Chloroflexota bacterium]
MPEPLGQTCLTTQSGGTSGHEFILGRVGVYNASIIEEVYARTISQVDLAN